MCLTDVFELCTFVKRWLVHLVMNLVLMSRMLRTNQSLMASGTSLRDLI